LQPPAQIVRNEQGVACPLNFVKAKLKLEKPEIGDILEVLLDEGEPVRNAPASFAEQGQQVLEVENLGEYFCVKVRRKKTNVYRLVFTYF